MERVVIEPHECLSYGHSRKYYYVYLPGRDSGYLLWDEDLDIDTGIYLTREFVRDIENEFGSMDAFRLYMEIEYR